MKYPVDIQSAMIAYLNDGITGLNAKIDEINLARSTDCPNAELIHSGVQEFQYPEVFVDIGENTEFTVNDDQDHERIELSEYIQSMIVTAVLQTTEVTKIDLWKEIFGMAIFEVLNNRLFLDETVRVKIKRITRASVISQRTNEPEELIQAEFEAEYRSN